MNFWDPNVAYKTLHQNILLSFKKARPSWSLPDKARVTVAFRRQQLSEDCKNGLWVGVALHVDKIHSLSIKFDQLAVLLRPAFRFYIIIGRLAYCIDLWALVRRYHCDLQSVTKRTGKRAMGLAMTYTYSIEFFSDDVSFMPENKNP